MLFRRNNKASHGFGFGKKQTDKDIQDKIGFVKFLESWEGSEVCGGNICNFGFIAKLLGSDQGYGFTFGDSLWRYFYWCPPQLLNYSFGMMISSSFQASS